jgi:hypothetical protein
VADLPPYIWRFRESLRVRELQDGIGERCQPPPAESSAEVDAVQPFLPLEA